MKHVRSLSKGIAIAFTVLHATSFAAAQPVPDIRTMVNEGHKSTIWMLAFSPDSTMLASASHDNTVRLWDVRTGKLVRVLPGPTTGFVSVSFSRDGSLLAAGGMHGVMVWKTNTWECLHTLKNKGAYPVKLSFGPGTMCASGAEYWNGEITVWDALNGSVVRRTTPEIRNVHPWIRALAFHRDGAIVVTGGEDNNNNEKNSDYITRIWDARSGTLLRELHGHAKAISAVAVSPDGKTVVSSGWDRSIRLWDSSTGKAVRSLEHSAHSLSFSEDGESLLSFGYDGEGEDKACSLKLWKPGSGRIKKKISLGRHVVGQAGALSPDGRTIAAAGTFIGKENEYDTVKLWDAETGELLHTMKGRGYDSTMINTVALSADGARLGITLGEKGNKIKTWDLSGAVPPRPLETYDYSKFDRDLKNVIFYKDGMVQVKDVASGAVIKTLGTGISLSFLYNELLLPAQNGRTPISAEDVYEKTNTDNAKYLKSQVVLWDMDSGSMKSIDIPAQYYFDLTTRKKTRDFMGIQRMALSADEKLIAVAAGHAFTSVFLIDRARGAVIKTIGVPWTVSTTHDNYSGIAGRVSAIAVSPDKTIIVTASDWNGTETTIKLWNAPGGKCIATRKDHSLPVQAAAFSPDGKILATAGDDADVMLREGGSGRIIRAMKGHTLSVRSLCFTRDGRYLLSGSFDNTVRIWSTAQRACVATIYNFSDTEWAAVSRDGSYDGTPGGIEKIHFVVDSQVVLLKDFDRSFHRKDLLAALFSPERVRPGDEEIRGTLIGKIHLTGGEVVVASGRAAELLRMGAKVFVVVDGKKVQLQVSFPMMTTARCRLLDASYAGRMKAGMPVFK